MLLEREDYSVPYPSASYRPLSLPRGRTLIAHVFASFGEFEFSFCENKPKLIYVRVLFCLELYLFEYELTGCFDVACKEMVSNCKKFITKDLYREYRGCRNAKWAH